MDRKKEEGQEEGLPAANDESRKEGERHRRELDDVPPPGTDPLHEGP